MATNLQYGHERRARLCSRLARSRTRIFTMIETSEDPVSATLDDPGGASRTASAAVEAAASAGGPIYPDVGILSLAKEQKLNLPLAAATKKQYDRMVAEGLGELDKSGIAELTFKGRLKSKGKKK